MRPEPIASVDIEAFWFVAANDAGRSSFTVSAPDRLRALSGTDLSVVAEWPIPDSDDPVGRGHATSPELGLALVCGVSSVRLLRRDGTVAWTYGHTPWSGDFECGCAWFDAAGRPWAVVCAPDWTGCLIVRFDVDTGEIVDQVHIEAAPNAIRPVHHPDGWVGLDEGEGQDRSATWWVRARPDGTVDVVEAGWYDQVFADVHPGGDRVNTTGHCHVGPVVVRSFPDLLPERELVPPGEELWGYEALFVTDRILIRQQQDDLLLVDDRGSIDRLDVPVRRWINQLVSAADDTWLVVEPDRIQRWALR
jgi:hypothetical protein